jgi:hypothetical protein
MDGLLGRSPLGQFLLGRAASAPSVRNVGAASAFTLPTSSVGHASRPASAASGFTFSGPAIGVAGAVSRVTVSASASASRNVHATAVTVAALGAGLATTRDLRIGGHDSILLDCGSTAVRCVPVEARSGLLLGQDGDAFKVFDIGRLRRGDRATLFVETVAVPDFAPVAVVLNPAGDTIAAVELPSWKKSRVRFCAPLRIDQRFDLGRYTVTYRYTVGGVPVIAQDVLDVVPGGDSGGEVISLYALDRTKSRLVIAQLGCGRLARGKNPTI